MAGETQEVDPKNLTEDDVRGMSEDELMKLTGEAPVAPPTGQQDPPPAAASADGAAASDTGKGTPRAGTPKAEGTEQDPPAAPPGEGSAPGATETTYAGKYKSPEALIEGMGELAKKLGYPYADHADRLIEAAKASTSFKDLEAAYAKYEQELGKRTAPPAAPAAGAEPGKATSADAGEEGKGTLSEAETRQIQDTVKNVFTTKLSVHPVMQKFAAVNEPIPRNQDELNALAQRNFVLAQSYMAALTEVRDDVAAEFAEIGKLKSSLPTLQQTALTDGTTALKAFSEKLNLKLTDEEITALVKEAMASNDPLIVEERHGFKVPRSGGVLRWFKAEKLDAMIERVRVNSESDGRRKHAEELEKMKKASRESIGTATLPGRKLPETAGKTDLNDPDQVRLLSEDQLEAALR